MVSERGNRRENTTCLFINNLGLLVGPIAGTAGCSGACREHSGSTHAGAVVLQGPSGRRTVPRSSSLKVCYFWFVALICLLFRNCTAGGN